MARKTNIYTLLHNANIGEYVTDSIDIFDSYSNLSQYDFNKSVRSMIANSAVIGGVSNLKLKITPSSFYVKSSEGCTLTCEVTFNGEDYTDVVIKWQIERISVNKQDDQEWFEKKNGENATPLTNVIEITELDLNGDAAMFIVTAIITNDMKCDNSVSLMGYSTQGLFTFDLNNQIDFVATDNMFEVQWNQYIETRATLTYGSLKVIPDEITFEYNGLPDGCATYNNKDDFDITVLLAKGQKVSYNNALIISVAGTYKGERYNKQVIFTIKADTDGVTYNVAPSRDKIRLSSTGVYTPTTFSCGVRKKTINGVTYPKELPGTLKLTMTIDDGEELEITPKTVIRLFGDNMTVVNSGIIFTLYEKGQFLDSEWVPVISDGVTGESTIKLDLDNEMDAIPVDANYTVLEDTEVISNATMYYGYDEMTFVRNANTRILITTPDEEEEEYLNNIKTKLTFKKNNKLLTISLTCEKNVRIPRRITVTLYAMGAYGNPGDTDYKAKVLSAIFSVMPMVVTDETPLYYLIPSANCIKVDKTNARQPINIGVTCKKRTGTTGYITTDYGYVQYRIDDEKVQQYTKPLDTEDIGELILFEYYDDNGELLDRETVPVIFDGKDGTNGRSIKDMHEYYLATATKEDIPSYDEEWLQDEFPDQTLFNEEYPYLWNYEETIYINYGDDPSMWRSTPSIITRYVKGIKSIDEYYLAVPENSGIDTSYVKEQDIFLTKNGAYEWQKQVIPEMSDISAYLWNFERINFDTGTFTTTVPGIIGIHGESNFFMDIDNQQDFVAVDQYGYVIPSTVHYDESIIKYADLDRFGHITQPLKPHEIIFMDNPSNEGTVIISSNFTVYYGNTKAQVKGIGFEYSDSTNFFAEAYNIPNTIYPIIITHDNSSSEESAPDLKGSYYNPYTVEEAIYESNSAGHGTAGTNYVQRGDVYVTAYIVGYVDSNGDRRIGQPGVDVEASTIKGILLYDKVWTMGTDNVQNTLLVRFDKEYTDIAIYNPEPDAADITESLENPADPKIHPYGLNIKNKVIYLDKIVTIMGIIQNSALLATDFAELYYGEDIVRFSSVFGAYDLSTINFNVFVKPNALISKINWVRIAVDIEAFGKLHRSYAILSLYAAAPGQDARFYQLQPSHKQIQRKKNGTYVPTIDTNITCHIVKRIGNDFLYNIDFYNEDDPDNDAHGDVSLFYAFDSGDFIYVPFTDPEYSEILEANANPDVSTYDDEGNEITNRDKYLAIHNIPPIKDTLYKERKDPTMVDTYKREGEVNGDNGIIIENEIEYGKYLVAKEDNGRRSMHYGEFPMWKLRDIFNSYLNPDGTFITDENGNILRSFTLISFLLTDAKTGEQVDLVLIPVAYDGEETIIADLTNEMDAVAMNELNYTIAETVLKTVFTIHVGKENKILVDGELYPGQIGSKAPALLHLLLDEDHELPLIKFYERDKNKVVTEYVTGLQTNASESKIYWEYLHDAETNEYELTIYVPSGIGDESILDTPIWKHDRVIIEVRGCIEHVSSSPNNPLGTMLVERSTIFTIHGVPCGEDGVIYQILPTYNNIKINDIGEFMPDTIDCFITRRYGTADPSVYREFNKIYKNFLMGPAERTEHEFGRDALVIGYSIDNENNLNTNGYLPAHWWVHKGFNDGKIQADDENDTGTYFPFPADPQDKTVEEILDGEIPDEDFFDLIDYPSIPSYRIAEQITFYLYQKTLRGDYRLLDLETIPVVEGSHETNPNLVNGTEDGGISIYEKWTTSGEATTGLHNFRLTNNTDKLTSPKIFMQPGKEFIVSLECRLLTVSEGEDFANDEDIEMVPPEYADTGFTPPIYTDILSKRTPREKFTLGQLSNLGYHTLTLEFFVNEDEYKIPRNVNYSEDDEEVINGSKTTDDIKTYANPNGILYYQGHNNEKQEGSRNTVIITNWGNSDKSRFKEWTRIKFKPYQADDIIADTENAYFTLNYNRPGGSNYILQIRHIKLEYGDVATTWIPSAWDSKGETTERVFEFYYATADLNDSPNFYKTVEQLEAELERLGKYPKTWENSITSLDYQLLRPNKTITWYRHTKDAGHGLDKPYLWNVEVIVNQHDLIASVSDPALITVSGQKIKEIHEFYLATDKGSGVTINDSGWVEYNPNSEESLDKYTFGLNDKKNYLWNYEHIIFTIGEDMKTEPVIVSVFNSNLRIDIDNEVDAIPVDHETYILSSDKNIELNSVLSFYHGTTKMALRKIYAVIDVFTDEFNARINEMDLATLMDVFHLNVKIDFIVKLILKASNVIGSTNTALDENLTTLQATLSGMLVDPAQNSDDNIFAYINENVSKKFIIERMIMNAISVFYEEMQLTIIIPRYKCLVGETGDEMIDESLIAGFPKRADDILGIDEVKLKVIARSDATTGPNDPKKIFPKIVDQRIPIKFVVSGSHLSSDVLKDEIYESSAVFSLMIFEGDGVFQLVPSCSEIKETSLGIQYATGTPPNFIVRNSETGNLYIDGVDETAEIENIDFITCKILYRKGAEDSSIYMNYNDVSTYLILEISDDGGAYIKPGMWGAERGVYKGTPYSMTYIVEETGWDETNKESFLYTRPLTRNELKPENGFDPSTNKFYNLGTGYYPHIPLFTQKVADDLIENSKTKSNWFISNAVTFKLKVLLKNQTTGKTQEVLVDSETIPVVKDGKDGLDGASQARNYLDGTDDGSEFVRRLTIKNITNQYYESNLSPFIISPPEHMYVNSAIANAVKIQFQLTDRDYVRLSGLLKLSEYDPNSRNNDGYHISWGKPCVALTVAFIVRDGKNIIKNGTYYTTELIFNVLEDNGSKMKYPEALEALTNNLSTNQEIKVLDAIRFSIPGTSGYSMLPKSKETNGIINIANTVENGQVLGQVRFSKDEYPYLGLTFIASGAQYSINVEKTIYINLFEAPIEQEYEPVPEGEEAPYVKGIVLAPYVEGGTSESRSTEEDEVIDYAIKWYATPCGFTETKREVNIPTRWEFIQNGVEEDPVYPNIKISIVNPTLLNNNVFDVSTINFNTLNEYRNLTRQQGVEQPVIMLDELVSIPSRFYNNSYVKLSSFMLPEIEIEYSNFKLETETDAPKGPSTWTLSEADKKMRPNYNILFGAETGYYENTPYWTLANIDDKIQSRYLKFSTDQSDSKGVIQLQGSNLVLKCKNLNIITPNVTTHYTFSFDAMYTGDDLMNDKLDVYFMYDYNPPFEGVDSFYTASKTADGETYHYTTSDGDVMTPPVLEKSDIFDAVSGTYVYAHESFTLTQGYKRYSMFTPNAREIKSEVLFDAPYVYNFYILIVHPGSKSGISRKSNVFIKKPKLEKGLIPTAYEINLDEYKGCTYELIPYFETVEVRTEKPGDYQKFDVTTENFDSIRTIEDEETGDTLEVSLADSIIYSIAEIGDEENIMDWYTFYNDYSNIEDDNYIAYICTGRALESVATPKIEHYTEGLNPKLTLMVSTTTPYAKIHFYIHYKILYLMDSTNTAEDFEQITLSNGTLWTDLSAKQPLTTSATVYAIATRDMYNNSELATYVYEPIDLVLNYDGTYTSYITNNSLAMNCNNSDETVFNLKESTIIFNESELALIREKTINTFMFTFATNKQIARDTYIIVLKYTLENEGNNLVFTPIGEPNYIIIFKSECTTENIVKYTSDIVVSNAEYLGFSADNSIYITTKINTLNKNCYYNNAVIEGKCINADVGYTVLPD